MGIFSRHKKKKEPAKTPVPKKEPVKDYGYRIPASEMESTKIMASRLASTKTIAEFCKTKGLGNPEAAFMRFYEGVNQNRALWKLEVMAEEAAEKAGKPFNREVFYGKLFMRCGGNPLNASGLLFKR